ncbi:MAG: hypothetical protein M3453_12500 [Pseudomonadota bacterium]|nr:hypothetical protein [Pseudomonadota bacterium]
MNEPHYGRWQDMASAPRDGARVLVEVRASEQGPAEVDVARWAKPDRSAEACWIAADSDPGCVIAYAEAELLGWMPLPAPLPKLRPTSHASSRPEPARADSEEIGGSGI